jgi:hypothetical protein
LKPDTITQSQFGRINGDQVSSAFNKLVKFGYLDQHERKLILSAVEKSISRDYIEPINQALSTSPNLLEQWKKINHNVSKLTNPN